MAEAGETFVFQYTFNDKLQPPPRADADNTYVPVAQRKLQSIDYVNNWKEDVTEYWVAKFSYFIEPRLPGAPRLGPFKGEGARYEASVDG
jgi:hypothetical protein